MSRFLIFYLFTVLLMYAHADDDDQTYFSENEPTYTDDFPAPDKDVAYAIQKFEQKADAAAKAESEGVLPYDETEHFYEEMATAGEDIVELLNANPNNAYAFLKDKGVERVILPNLQFDNPHLRTQLLMAAKILFDIAPTTTNIATPIFMVDKLIDIFEMDESAPIKAHVLDVLSVWLPNNPKVQARLMKVKGLDPFYRQIARLDPALVQTLLELFNNIFKEHLKVKSENVQRSKADLERAKIYQKIGLIERVSNPTFCKGLLNIFGTAWSFRSDDEEVMVPVLELLKNIKPYCIKSFSSKKSIGKAEELFQSFLNHVRNAKAKVDNIIAVNLNLTAIEQLLEDYLDTLKSPSVKEDL